MHSSSFSPVHEALDCRSQRLQHATHVTLTRWSIGVVRAAISTSTSSITTLPLEEATGVATDVVARVTIELALAANSELGDCVVVVVSSSCTASAKDAPRLFHGARLWPGKHKR